MFVLQEPKLDEEMQKVLKENQKLWIELQNQCEEHEAEKEKNLEKFEEQRKVHEKTSLTAQKLQSISKEQAKQTEFELSDFSQARGINSRYGMKSFSAERKDRVNDWKRPAIYPNV